MIAELLRYSFGTATLAECADSRGNGLPDFLGTGMVSALQRRHEQGIGLDGADAEVVHRWPHHEPPRPLAPLTTSPEPDTVDLYLAEQPGRLVIPAHRKHARGLQNSGCPYALFNGPAYGPTPRRSPGQRQKRMTGVPASGPCDGSAVGICPDTWGCNRERRRQEDM
jgi:hypothetical protein